MVNNLAHIVISKSGELKKHLMKLGTLKMQDGSELELGLVPHSLYCSVNEKGEYTEKVNGGSKASYWFVTEQEDDSA